MMCIKNSVKSISFTNWSLRFSIVLDDDQSYNMCLKSFKYFMDISESGIMSSISRSNLHLGFDGD